MSEEQKQYRVNERPKELLPDKILICNCSDELDGQIYQQKLPSGKVLNTTRITNKFVYWDGYPPVHVSDTPLRRIDKLEDVIKVYSSLPLRLDNETEMKLYLLHKAGGRVKVADIYNRIRNVRGKADISDISWQRICKIIDEADFRQTICKLLDKIENGDFNPAISNKADKTNR